MSSMARILYNNNCERSELSGLFNGTDFFYIYIYIYNIYVTVHAKTLRKSAILISRYRSVTGILVREILVRGTKIFSGKLVRPDRFFREKWSASGKLVRTMVRPRGGYRGGAMGALAPPLPESGRVYSVRTRSVT